MSKGNAKRVPQDWVSIIQAEVQSLAPIEGIANQADSVDQ